MESKIIDESSSHEVFPFDDEIANNVPKMLKILSFIWFAVMIVTILLI